MKFNIDTLIFDLDSTLVKIEGLDWLASKKGVSAHVVELTKSAMNGQISFRDSMIKKMEIISPSHSEIISMGHEYCKNLVKDADKVVDYYIKKNVDVWIVTGNFHPAVEMVAKKLGIKKKNVVCNKIFFDHDGRYVGFDLESPLSSNGGKSIVVKNMPDYKSRKIAFVGDGVTDLETKDCVELFIGYGGVNSREIVKKNADFFIDSPSLSPIIDLLGD